VRLEMLCVAVAAAVLAGIGGPGTATAEEMARPNPCPHGKDALTITFAIPEGSHACEVKGDVPDACVHAGASIHWTLVNENCDFNESQTAVEMSAAKLKKDKTKRFNWECTPKKNGWPKKSDVKLDCKVPKDTDEGVYKYDITGQIKPVDPDIEIRR
jgi:hypothetical protein